MYTLKNSISMGNLKTSCYRKKSQHIMEQNRSIDRQSEHGGSCKSLITESTPSPNLRSKLCKSTTELIKELSPTSPMEYSYYVIASPVFGHKIAQNNRSYSFVSMSSKESSSSEVSSVIQPKKRAPKSRGLLQSVKEKLLKEIEIINIELVKMDSERLILSNLRNASLLYRDMVCQSERNNQGIPNTQKIRSIVESIELKIKGEEKALAAGDLSIPYADDVKKDLQDFINICQQITRNKTSLKISLVEELLSAIGKVYGDVDTLLKMFYEHEEITNQEEDDVINDVITPQEGSEDLSMTDDITEDHFDDNFNVDSQDNNNKEPIDAPISDYLNSQTEEDNSHVTLSSTSSEIINTAKTISALKGLLSKLSKIKKRFKSIERLSLGNPKPKSLRTCFREIADIIMTDPDEESDAFNELPSQKPWSKCIMGNIVDLQNHLLVERPGERELEHIRILTGELCGRINIVLKSNVLE